MSSTLFSCTKFCTSNPLPPSEDPGIYGGVETGASLIGIIANVFTTGFEKLRSISHQTEHKSMCSQILEKPGQNLKSPICKIFFKRIAKERSHLNVIETFFTDSISDSNVDELKTKLITELLNKKLNTGPICIPIVMGHNDFLEAMHIAVLQIIDNNIYYYDSKAIASKYRKLKDGHTIRDLVEMCKQVLTDSKGKIEENSTIHQWDTYNCAAYVSHYIFQTLVMGKTHKELQDSSLPLDYIHQFRNAMAHDLDRK